MISFEEIQNYCKDKSVIIVGNSGSLKESGKGSVIDSYDIVLRMNHGVPGKWTKDVGARTDIWFFSYHYRNKQLAEYNLLIPKFAISNAGETRTHDELRGKVYTFPPKQRLEIKQSLLKVGLPQGKHPTTGFLCINWFLNYVKTQKKLDIVGFDFFETHLNFFEPDGLNKKTAVAHRPNLEKPIIENLINKKIIGQI